MISKEEHKQRHVKLHRYLDELLADWIARTGKLPSKATVMEFLTWSYQETLNPTDKK